MRYWLDTCGSTAFARCFQAARADANRSFQWAPCFHTLFLSLTHSTIRPFNQSQSFCALLKILQNCVVTSLWTTWGGDPMFGSVLLRPALFVQTLIWHLLPKTTNQDVWLWQTWHKVKAFFPLPIQSQLPHIHESCIQPTFVVPFCLLTLQKATLAH